MDLSRLVSKTAQLVSDKSPAIFTAIGVAGALTTAYLSAKATRDYMTDLAGEGYYNRDYEFDRTPREHLEKAWKFYIPAAGTAIMTVGCIIAANAVGTRRAAAVAAAYAISDKAFEEYRSKVIDRIGDKKEEEVRASLAKDRISQTPQNIATYFIGSGETDFFDEYSGRYFKSDLETVRKAANDLNEQILHHGSASLTDFYYKIGLPRLKHSDEVGWNTDKLMNFQYTAVLSESNIPCISIEYTVAPYRNY